MPGSISVQNAQGAPTISPDADFGICVIGYSTASPLSSGLVTPPYSSPAAAAADLSIGDAVDLLCQGITVRPTNPAPRGVSFYQTPPTTEGVRGSTLTVSGVTGTSVVSKTASTHPKGTYQPVGRTNTGGTIGVAGIVNQFSLDAGRTWLPPVALGTATSQKVQLSVNGVMTDTGVQYDFAAGTLNALDTWSESTTTPPMFGTSDLYAAGPPATGAFAAIAQSANSFGLIVISEPVAASDFATLTAGLNYLEPFNKRPVLLVRFRDPTASETDAQYITAFQTFAAACQDDRIAIVAGNGWLTDAFRGFRYFRSGLPAVVARLQWLAVNPGQYGERLAKSPAFGGDGPLPDFSLVDDNGNPIARAHDEFVRGGIDGPMGAGTGGGITFCYQRAVGVAGTYISKAPVLYPALGKILTLMDSRVARGIQRELYAIAWTMIQGSAVVNGGVMDPDLRAAMATKMKAAILAKFANEIANPGDPNLVVVNPVVTVSGSDVSLTVSVNDRLFFYINGIAITLYNIRSS
jgi:hypothetical protein